MSDPENDRRKVTITIQTTPAELRNVAALLEKGKRVRVSWFHTRYEFVDENKIEADSKMPAREPDSVEVE
ncbi:MAG: hypothetical protein MJA29_03590 [Candidatus Omnitrophica bacterium]|nr:hypothetical protein [Candidatus Omnitrophota bacterium]